MTCPQSQLITDYLAEKLSDETAESFEQHLEECDSCVTALTESGQSMRSPAWLLSAHKRIGEGRLRSLFVQAEDSFSSSEDFPASSEATTGSSVRYSWKRRIGAGGMGEVWEGWDHLMRRPVALKRLRHRSSDFEGGQRLLQEATTLSRLSCAHIVKVYGVIADEVRPVLVMEYIPGLTLSQWQDGRPLRQKDAAEVALILAQSLQHAHGQGVIHRDLKPSNILLRTTSAQQLPRDEHGVLQIWLSDFGLARVADDPSLTISGQLLGTPVYMAPEQLSGAKTADCRTDVYGLGAILYELLTGVPPFMGVDGAVLMQLIRTEDPVSPRRLQILLSRDIETICLKCLARRPADRYVNAEAVAADLQAFISDRPIVARPLSLPTRMLRWSGRNPALSATLLSTFAALLLALLFGTLAVREQATMLSLQQRTAEHEKHLRMRAEAAEQEAQQRAAEESLLRSKHEALLLQMLKAVDSHLLASGAPATSATSSRASSLLDSSFPTNRVLTEYLQSLEHLDQPLSWTELELMIRLLSLKVHSHDAVGVDALVAQIDETLLWHLERPQDPVQYVDFLKVRHMLFGSSQDVSSTYSDIRNVWLSVAARFLEDASKAEPGSARMEDLLNARCEALVQAWNAGRSAVQFPDQSEVLLAAYLRDLSDLLRRPIPKTNHPRSAESDLLNTIQSELDRLAIERPRS